MTKRWWILVLWMSGALAVAAGGPGVQSKPTSRLTIPPGSEASLREVYDAYADGDDLAVERWLRTSDSSVRLPYIQPFVTREASWSRTRAAFVLEVLVQRPMRVSELFDTGRAMVSSRPTPPGRDATQDRFEVLWHQTAIGLAESLSRFEILDQYLQRVTPRFEEARKNAAMQESRIPLARAFAAGLFCCWKAVPGEVVRHIPRQDTSRAAVAQALVLYEQAASSPALRVEALVRGAKLLAGAGLNDEALAWLERVPKHDDRSISFVQHMTHGRLLDARDRPADAVAAYRAALEVAPLAQRPAIGLAAALLRSGQVDEAVRVAADARGVERRRGVEERLGRVDAEGFQRRMEDDGVRLLSEFHQGDLRFVEGWLAEIRKLRR
jgi:hypothetical protein